MKAFKNFKYMIVDSDGDACYGSGGVRTYKTLKAAEKQFNGSDYYKRTDCKIVEVGYKEVV